MAIPSGSDVSLVQTSLGDVRYRDTGGSGEPILLIHSLLLDPDLYSGVVPRLVAAGYRCVLPELPLGGHATALLEDADRSPDGLVRIIVDVLDHARIDRASVVGVDTGGALAQLLMAHQRERVDKVVLTACDAYEDFPPRSALGRLLKPAFHRRTIGLTARAARSRWGRRALVPRAVTHRGVDDALLVQWTRGLRDPEIRRDLQLAFSAMHSRYTLEAAELNKTFPRQVLIAWGDDDRLFKRRLALRLEQDLPHARLVVLADCAAFAAIDQPERLADLIVEHLTPSAASGQPSAGSSSTSP
jgi:pimeloyl-ACP methyl ester carboxylesterase